jgi:hypothetical protein
MAPGAMERIQSDDRARGIYEALLGVVSGFGDYQVEPKKTSLHVTHGRAFLGISPRVGALVLNLVTEAPLASERIRKSEQVSRNRWHNEVLITGPADLDLQLIAWLREAYALTM